VLDSPRNLDINPIFNEEDLTLHRGTFEPPSLPFGAFIGARVIRLLPLQQSHTSSFLPVTH